MEEGLATTWNKKRIGAFILLMLLAISGFFYFKLNGFSKQTPKSTNGPETSVEGAQTQDNKAESIQGTIKQGINNLKQEVSNLNIVEIASSSPQVQKILNDIKSLEQYPSNQVKDICRKICGL